MRLPLAILMTAFPAALLAAPPRPASYPQGPLPDAARPTAYRLDLTILPDRPRFSGHVEIDIEVKKATSSLFLHGRDLKMAKAEARAGTATIAARYSQVDPLGVARLDFAKPIPAGKVTLSFNYDAPFGDAPSGLFHVKVADHWYAWTQFESIDARAAYPSFDEPGFKTPFTVSVTTNADAAAYSNTAETGSVTVNGLVKHSFAPTKPLPTYLVAFGTGPFASVASQVPPTPERAEPLDVRIIGTQPNKDKMESARQNTGQIIALLEKYFGRPFPFPKLDQIGSPIMPGAMENAGADTYADSILFLDQGAATAQKQAFGMVVAHELSHQWFGDLVTPKWWDDIWLNESFANWMGYRIGNEWRPDLKVGVGAIDEAFLAMGIDALKAGRPIHQPIKTNGEIDAAFDAVTYGKGGQVVAMIAAYLGDEKFQRGVRFHLDRHAYGNASTEDFFAAMAQSANDPRVLTALKSFVDQQGVPVVHIERTAGGLRVSQKRFAMFGTQMPAQSWTIPLCIRVGEARQCQLLDKATDILPMTGSGVIMPNAGGTGYYRFSMPVSDWHALIGLGATLPPGEVLALTDSLWASFQAGETDFALLLESAKETARNPYSGAAVEGGQRLAGLRSRGMIPDAALPGYRAFLDATYAPRLAELGFDPKAGAFAADDPDRQKLRSDIAALLAGEADDKQVKARLAKAAETYLSGDTTALDQSLLDAGFGAYLASDGGNAAKLFEKGVQSDDSLFRGSAMGALGDTGEEATGRWVLSHMEDSRLRSNDRIALLSGLLLEPATRDIGYAWFIEHYDALVKQNGIFYASALPDLPSRYCSAQQAAVIEAAVRPKVRQYHRGDLSLDRTVERVKSCGLLKDRRAAEIGSAFQR